VVGLFVFRQGFYVKEGDMDNKQPILFIEDKEIDSLAQKYLSPKYLKAYVEFVQKLDIADALGDDILETINSLKGEIPHPFR